jgi:cellulose synthase/poly-beta-1,6-N-acetylglucosamine synthase-like glycosyltransferase
MDPDHVPEPDFLTRTLGYFNDPDVGFVVAPQVYGNLEESWIAHGAAVQAYVFHGVIQRGANGSDAPLLIGTNHLYRPSAFAQIGGYQDSIIEDHLTSMAMYGHINPDTGNRWKGVYTPDIVAVGEGPTSFTDYFNQQKRWAYGIWEIAGRHSRRMFGLMRPLQRLSFTLLQLFYPSVAVSWILGNAATAIHLFGGDTARLPAQQWLPLWGASMTMSLFSFFWLRRFNLVDHERRELGLTGLGLFMACLPIYVSAACAFLARKPLAYAVTAKGNLTSPDSMRTFRAHLVWIGVAVATALVALLLGTAADRPHLLIWVLMTVVVAATPVVIHLGRGARSDPAIVA